MGASWLAQILSMWALIWSGQWRFLGLHLFKPLTTSSTPKKEVHRRCREKVVSSLNVDITEIMGIKSSIKVSEIFSQLCVWFVTIKLNFLSYSVVPVIIFMLSQAEAVLFVLSCDSILSLYFILQSQIIFIFFLYLMQIRSISFPTDFLIFFPEGL